MVICIFRYTIADPVVYEEIGAPTIEEIRQGVRVRGLEGTLYVPDQVSGTRKAPPEDGGFMAPGALDMLAETPVAGADTYDMLAGPPIAGTDNTGGFREHDDN